VVEALHLPIIIPMIKISTLRITIYQDNNSPPTERTEDGWIIT
jgi:hypothetical protein